MDPDTPWERPQSFLAFGRALRAARLARGLTLDALAQATGISKPYLSNIETARAPGPPLEDKLRKLARALDLDPKALVAGADWLRTPPSVRTTLAALAPASQLPRRDDGAINLDALLPAAGTSSGTTGAAPTDPARLPVRQVPLINKVAAGKAGEHGDLSYPAGIADAYIPAPDLPGAPVAAAFALKIQGDSMMPEYRDGDVIVVGPGDAQDGDDCVVRLGEKDNYATTFKRVFFLRASATSSASPGVADAPAEVTALRLVPLNPAHQERTVNVEEVTGVYPLMYRLVPPKARVTAALKKASEKLRE